MQNALIFSFVLIFFLMLGYSVPQLGTTPQGQAANASYTGLKNSIGNLSGSINNTYYLPIFGSIPFPNVFGIFSGTYQLLISLVSLPGNTLGALIDLPETLRNGFTLLLTIITVISILTWYKGQSQ